MRILEAHWSADSLRSIAEGLNREGVPTAHGGNRWYASTVDAVLGSQAARELDKAAADFTFPKQKSKRVTKATRRGRKGS
jgi:hypothetical protein